jgi:AmmeMemoRadiSam system protein A/AmmeMemoRadiSam system protein B
LSTVSLAQAGRFFPAEPTDTFAALDDAWQSSLAVELPHGAEVIISPHAGYRFCADVGARAYRAARKARRVLLLSPSHYEGFDGMAVPSHHGFHIGEKTVPLDVAARNSLAAYLSINDTPHAREHGIETQIPMLAHWLEAPYVLPVIIGRAKLPQIAELIGAWRKFVPDGLVVLSSDLSHRLPRAKADAHDQMTASFIETAQGEQITGAHACGWQTIGGALAVPEISGLRAVRLGMTNSARVTGDENGTVGYGAWAFLAADAMVLGPKARGDVVRVVRQMVAGQLKRSRAPELNTKSFCAALQGQGASFVTWKKQGQLRGCIGTLVPHRPLIEDIAQNATKSAFKDPRFAPVSNAEFSSLELKVAILSNPAAMQFTDETDLISQLQTGRDGLILSDGKHRGTFLPMVWESLPNPKDFLCALKQKAGLPKDHWSDTLQVQRYLAETIPEIS